MRFEWLCLNFRTLNSKEILVVLLISKAATNIGGRRVPGRLRISFQTERYDSSGFSGRFLTKAALCCLKSQNCPFTLTSFVFCHRCSPACNAGPAGKY